jgi:hypothetical protein
MRKAARNWKPFDGAERLKSQAVRGFIAQRPVD